MGELSINRHTSSPEILRRSDEAWRRAFAELKANQSAGFGIAIPKAITDHYAKKRLCSVAFVKLEEFPDRGTMRASADGSIRRSFSFRTKGTAVEEQSSDSLILMAMPRQTRIWINSKFSGARLGWPGVPDLIDGDWTDQQRTDWQALCETSSRIEEILERGRRPTPRRHKGNGRVHNPW